MDDENPTVLNPTEAAAAVAASDAAKDVTPPAAKADPPKNKGGRPKGAVDKRPRARKPGAEKPAPKKPAPDPLADEVPGDEPAKKPGKAGPPKDIAELFTVSSAELAALAVTCMNLGMVKVVQSRFGDAPAAGMALNTEEAAELVKATDRVIAKYIPKMTAEWALVFTIAMIYGNKVVTYQLSKSGMTMEQAIELAQKHEAEMKAKADAAKAA